VVAAIFTSGLGTFSMLAAHDPTQNHLLAALPAADYQRLHAHLEPVALPVGLALYESATAQGYVYLPTTSIVSLLYVVREGASAQIAVVGKEGVVGIALFIAGETTPSRAVVHSAGYALRLTGSLFKREFERAGPLQILLLRYTQALIAQMAQSAQCNRHHGLEQQLCRWLLLSLDRLCSNELSLTRELMASVLGVRREGVVEAAGKLQAGGVIDYRRGKLTVLDRAQLEARACPCYGVVKGESERLALRTLVEEAS
jgi:CRP-like cAMP-binding protein